MTIPLTRKKGGAGNNFNGNTQRKAGLDDTFDCLAVRWWVEARSQKFIYARGDEV